MSGRDWSNGTQAVWILQDPLHILQKQLLGCLCGSLYIPPVPAGCVRLGVGQIGRLMGSGGKVVV